MYVLLFKYNKIIHKTIILRVTDLPPPLYKIISYTDVHGWELVFHVVSNILEEYIPPFFIIACTSLITNNPSTDGPQYPHPILPFARLGFLQRFSFFFNNNTLCFSNHFDKKQQNDKKW